VGAAAGDRQRQLGLGAAGFGLMMGCLGTGASSPACFVAAARRFGLERWCRRLRGLCAA
jgi:hypothetical protein